MMPRKKESLEEFMNRSMMATDMWVERMMQLSEMQKDNDVSKEEVDAFREQLRTNFEDKHDAG